MRVLEAVTRSWLHPENGATGPAQGRNVGTVPGMGAVQDAPRLLAPASGNAGWPAMPRPARGGAGGGRRGQGWGPALEAGMLSRFPERWGLRVSIFLPSPQQTKQRSVCGELLTVPFRSWSPHSPAVRDLIVTGWGRMGGFLRPAADMEHGRGVARLRRGSLGLRNRRRSSALPTVTLPATPVTGCRK